MGAGKGYLHSGCQVKRFPFETVDADRAISPQLASVDPDQLSRQSWTFQNSFAILYVTLQRSLKASFNPQARMPKVLIEHRFVSTFHLFLRVLLPIFLLWRWKKKVCSLLSARLLPLRVLCHCVFSPGFARNGLQFSQVHPSYFLLEESLLPLAKYLSIKTQFLWSRIFML